MRFRPRNRAARYMTWARYLVKIPWMFPSSPANSEYQTHQRPMQLQSTPMTIADDAHYMFTLSLQYTLFFEGIINSEHLEPITSGPSHEVHHNGSVLEERCERFLGNEHFSKVLGKRAPRSSGTGRHPSNTCGANNCGRDTLPSICNHHPTPCSSECPNGSQHCFH